MAEQAQHQAEQNQGAREDLDARVDALLREMESVSDRVGREMNENAGAPSLKDLAGAAGPEESGSGEIRPKRERATKVMADAAAELAGRKTVVAEDGAAKASGDGKSVEALDELLAAAAADVMAQEEDGSDVPVVAIAAPGIDGIGAEARTSAPAAATNELAATPRPARDALPAANGAEPGDGGVDEAVGAAVIDATARVLEVMTAPGRKDEKGNGPPNAPAATMAPPAERPGPVQRVADALVHSVTGAAASARPHVIRLMWRVEQYTLGLSAGVRATLKLLAVWTLLNAAAAWLFVMMQTPETARGAAEEVPSVISGAGESGSGGAEH